MKKTKYLKAYTSILAFATCMSSTASAATYGNGSPSWSLPAAASTPTVYSTSYSPHRNDGWGILDAIEDANAGGGGTVNLTTRTYYIYGEMDLKSKVKIQGTHKTNCILKRGSSMSGDDHLLFGENDNVDNVQIDKLFLHGNFTTSSLWNNEPYGSGIYLSSSTMENQKIRLTNLTMRRLGHGFLGGGIENFRIESCDIYENGSANLNHNIYVRRMGRILFANSYIAESIKGTGFKIWGGQTSSSSNENKIMRIYNCDISDNYKNNMETNGFGYVRVWASEMDDQYSSVSSYNAGALLGFGTVGSHYYDLINNRMINNNKYGIRVESANRVNIKGNYSNNNSNSNYSITGSNNVSCDYNTSL